MTLHWIPLPLPQTKLLVLRLAEHNLCFYYNSPDFILLQSLTSHAHVSIHIRVSHLIQNACVVPSRDSAPLQDQGIRFPRYWECLLLTVHS